MDSTILSTVIIDSFLVLLLIFLFVRNIKTTGLSKVRTIYLITLVFTFASISLASTFRTQMILDQFKFSYASFAFIGTLLAYPLGQSMKIFISPYSNKYQRKKDIITGLCVITGFLNVLLFTLSITVTNYDIIAIFSVIASFALGFVGGLFATYTTLFSNMNKESKLFRNIAIIAVIPFIGTIISTIPQSIIIVSGSVRPLSYQGISYLWLLSGLFALVAALMNHLFTVEVYGSKEASFVPTKETREAQLAVWKDSPKFNFENKYAKSGVRIAALGFFFMFSYSLCTGTLAPQYLSILNDSSNSVSSSAISMMRGYLPLMIATGSIVGTIFGFRFLLSKTKSDNLVIDLAFICMLFYFVINILNAYFWKSSILMFLTSFFLGYSYGVIYFYFLTISIKLSSKVISKIPAGMYFLFMTTIGTVVANSIAAVLLSTGTPSIDTVIVIFVISTISGAIAMFIYNADHASFTKYTKSSKHWGHVLEAGANDVIYINPFRKKVASNIHEDDMNKILKDQRTRTKNKEDKKTTKQ